MTLIITNIHDQQINCQIFTRNCDDVFFFLGKFVVCVILFQAARETLDSRPTAPPPSPSASANATGLLGPAGRQLETIAEVHREMGEDEIRRADQFEEVNLNDNGGADVEAPQVPPVNDSGDQGVRRSSRATKQPERYPGP